MPFTDTEIEQAVTGTSLYSHGTVGCTVAVQPIRGGTVSVHAPLIHMPRAVDAAGLGVVFGGASVQTCV